MPQQYGFAQQGAYGQQGNYGQQFGYAQQIGFGLQQQQQAGYGNVMVRTYIYLFHSQCTQCSLLTVFNIN